MVLHSNNPVQNTAIQFKLPPNDSIFAGLTSINMSFAKTVCVFMVFDGSEKQLCQRPSMACGNTAVSLG